MKTLRGLAFAGSLLTIAVLHAQVPTINSFTADNTTPPFGSQPTFTWSVAGASAIRISPGVGGLPASGSVTLPAPGLVSLLGSGASWKYLDTGADLGPSNQPNTAAAWFNPAFNDTAWLSGVTPLSYVNDDPAVADQSTDLRYGIVPTDDPLHPNKLNDVNNKLPTYYFRTKFPVTAQQITETQALYISLRRDDGAVVYLNGTEIFRHNLPAGVIDNVTLATVTVGGGEKGTYFRMAVPKSALLAGDNTLAVEVHQSGLTSSDIMMDVRVEAAVPSSTTPILNRGSIWKYLDDGSDQGTAWTTTGFSDTSWASGPGTLGYNNSVSNATGTSAGANTVASFGSDPSNKFITTYFRKKFHATGVSAFTDFLISANYDDGMVIYLNGIEIARAFMPPAGDILFSTLANNHEGDYALSGLAADADITVADPATIQSALVNGENTLAVEVHQSAPDSSDLSFNLQFDATDGLTTTRFIKPFATWSYLDTGADLGVYDSSGFNSNAWVDPAFVETGWKRGVAEIGYGDTNDLRAPSTGIDYGDDLAAKRMTTYFRRTVAIPDLASYANLTLELFRDDAAAVYVNGTEVFRDTNLPAGASSTTGATATSNATLIGVIPKTGFIAGNNVIAVEVHQESGGSSDVFFDMALYGNVLGNARVYILTAENANGVVTQNLTVTSGPLPASPIVLMTSLNGAVDVEPSWNTPYLWSDRLAPTADKDYEVLAAFARVLVTGGGAANARFSGRSLALGPRAILVLNNGDGEAAVCDDLRLSGGEVQSSFNGTAGTLQTRALTGAINVLATSALNPSGTDRELEIAAALRGTGTLIVLANNPAAGAVELPSAVVISGDNSAFTGNWDVSSRPFRPAHSNALGGTAASPNTLTMHSGYIIDPDADLVAPNTSVILRNTGGANPSQIVLDQNLQFQALSFVIDPVSEPLPEGVYTYATLTATQQAYFVDGPGTLTIGPGGGGAGDSDGDGLADAWELANFGSLAAAANQDPDADSYPNLAEFKLGTRPTDGSSFYKFTGPQAIVSVGVPSIQLTLTAQPGWTLQPQWSTSLLNGQWQNLGPPLTGFSSYNIIDNGAQSGTPPFTATSRTRFYRVEIFVP